MEPTRKISRVEPVKRDPNRYLDSNKKKKSKKTKIRQIYSYDCPWDKSYYSSSEKKVQKRLNGAKRKLQRQVKRNQ